MNCQSARGNSSALALALAAVAMLVAAPSFASFKGLRTDAGWGEAPIDTTDLPITYFSGEDSLGLVFTPLASSQLVLSSAIAAVGFANGGTADAVTWCKGSCDLSNGTTDANLAQAFFQFSSSLQFPNDVQVDLTFLCGYGFVATTIAGGPAAQTLPTQNCPIGTQGEVDASFLINPTNGDIDQTLSSTGPGTASVPEPALAGLLGLGLAGIAARRRARMI